MVIGFIEYLVTTDNYISFMDLHTLQITTPNIKASQFPTLDIVLISCLHSCWLATISQLTQRQRYVMTDGVTVSVSWRQAPLSGPRSDFYCCRKVAGLLMWNTPNKGLSVIFTAREV
jgi:hypothetical protein